MFPDKKGDKYTTDYDNQVFTVKYFYCESIESTDSEVEHMYGPNSHLEVTWPIAQHKTIIVNTTRSVEGHSGAHNIEDTKKI